MQDDEALAELERRLDELELLSGVVGGDSAASEGHGTTAAGSAREDKSEVGAQRTAQVHSSSHSAWARAEAASAALDGLEAQLSPRARDLGPGAECLAYSIADGAWLEAVVDESVAGGRIAVTFTASKQKRQVLDWPPTARDSCFAVE